MTPRASRPRRLALLLALALGACGRYADLAQKLDVTARIEGDTWIAAAGPDRAQTRILVVGRPDATGAAPFSFTAADTVTSGGTNASRVTTLQGTWTETGAGATGAATLGVVHTYVLPEEISKNIFGRRGAYRDDTPATRQVTVVRSGDRLVVGGDPELAGTYAPLVQALGTLGTSTPRDATCAFWLADLTVASSEARIIGFNSPGMFQYRDPQTYAGTIAGSVRVSLSGTFSTTTRIDYAAFEDAGGIVLTGPQVTDADAGGSGHLSGVLRFEFAPSAATSISGSIDYGNGANTVQISGGNPSGGAYLTSIDGGASALVSAVQKPAVTIADCLALP